MGSKVIAGLVLLSACGPVATAEDAAAPDSGVDGGRSECLGSGSWRAGPPTTDPRETSGLTLLPDGRVIVIGGHRSLGRQFWSVEVLDGLDLSWRFVAPLLRAREGIGDIITLADGRLLVVDAYGGAPPDDPLNDIAPSELYDPSRDVWMQTGGMLVPPAGSVTLLADGRVLSAGGMDWHVERPLARAEIYDPVTGTWSATDTLSITRFLHVAIRLRDDRVLMAGGYGDPTLTSVASAEIFDPTTARFEAAASMHVARASGKAVLLDDGRVLVAGGDARGAVTGAEIFDPRDGTWRETGSMRDARSLFSLTLLSDGRVLAVGGADRRTRRFDTAEVWSPTTEEWTSAGCMRDARSTHRAALLPSGEVIVVGGFAGLLSLRTVEIYTP